MKIGDVFWVDFPTGAGRAQAGRRPAVVLQADAVTKRLPTVLMIPLTTQIAALRYPGTVLIEPDATNGLTKPSVAMVFQLCAIDRRSIGSRLGAISPAQVETLRDSIFELTDGDSETA